jgi:hypothetical protein
MISWTFSSCDSAARIVRISLVVCGLAKPSGRSSSKVAISGNACASSVASVGGADRRRSEMERTMSDSVEMSWRDSGVRNGQLPCLGD